MGEVREEIIRTARRRDNTELDSDAVKKLINEKIDYLSFEALTETDDFAVLAMGRTETMGCYCPVNSLLREAIKTLSKGFDTILIDGEAGLEQVNRQVVKRLQTLMVISDPTSRGIETAAALKQLVESDRAMEVERLGIVFNRVRGPRTSWSPGQPRSASTCSASSHSTRRSPSTTWSARPSPTCPTTHRALWPTARWSTSRCWSSGRYSVTCSVSALRGRCWARIWSTRWFRRVIRASTV
ncbi:MAG: hypothetical protein M5U19_21175 [Microthrixaceae bacterium]|nr:hypothetical protein [Microthrixaceae bacterium]